MSGLLITGASGYLGGWLLRTAAAQGTGRMVMGSYFSRAVEPPPGAAAVRLDLADGAAVDECLARLRPAAIIHTACSNRDAGNLDAIVPAARHLAEAAQRHGARLVHVSTDMVFDGEHAPYGDDAEPQPVTDYGQAKAQAEAAVHAICPGAAIVRPSLIWCLDPLDKQTGWLVQGARDGSRVTLFTDEVRCPVHLTDLAAALLELADRTDLAGAFNLGGPQALNRWDFGRRLLEALGVPRGGNVVPAPVAASGLVRPRDLRLDISRAQQALRTRVRSVDEVLAELPERSRRPRYCEG